MLEKSIKRSKRRHDLNRMKQKAISVYGKWHGKRAKKYANHLAVCSCPGCGNPRKHYKEETMQEKKAKIEKE